MLILFVKPLMRFEHVHGQPWEIGLLGKYARLASFGNPQHIPVHALVIVKRFGEFHVIKLIEECERFARRCGRSLTEAKDCNIPEVAAIADNSKRRISVVKPTGTNRDDTRINEIQRLARSILFENNLESSRNFNSSSRVKIWPFKC